MTASSRQLHPWPVMCACGAEYHAEAWSRLPAPPAGDRLGDLQLRNCTNVLPNGQICNSTRAIVMEVRR